MAGFGAFLKHVFFSLLQEEEKNLKKNFSTSIIFHFIGNYTNYIHIFITCPLFPTGYFLQLISLLSDLKCMQKLWFQNWN